MNEFTKVEVILNPERQSKLNTRLGIHEMIHVIADPTGIIEKVIFSTPLDKSLAICLPFYTI